MIELRKSKRLKRSYSVVAFSIGYCVVVICGVGVGRKLLILSQIAQSSYVKVKATSPNFSSIFMPCVTRMSKDIAEAVTAIMHSVSY